MKIFFSVRFSFLSLLAFVPELSGLPPCSELSAMIDAR